MTARVVLTLTMCQYIHIRVKELSYCRTNNELSLENDSTIDSEIVAETARFGDEDVVVDWTSAGACYSDGGDSIGDRVRKVVVGDDA